MNSYLFVDQFTEYLIHQGIVPQEDKAIYAYGFRQAGMLVLNLSLTFVLAYAMGMVLPCFLFLAFYMPVRMFGGGYHARTPGLCAVLSIGMIFFILLGIRLVSHVGIVGAFPVFQEAEVPWLSLCRESIGRESPLHHAAGMMDLMDGLYSFFVSTVPWRLLFSFAGGMKAQIFLGGAGVAAALTIWRLAPMGDANKPLDPQEVRRYGWIARRCLLVELALCLGFFAFGVSGAGICALAALGMEALMLGIGWGIKYRRQR